MPDLAPFFPSWHRHLAAPARTALAAFVMIASPALAEAPRTIIVMDGSGSMWGQIKGRAKLEIARETVAQVLGTIPPEQELGLMAYGHREKGQCSDIELIVPPAPGTGTLIAGEVGKMRFLGKTPLSEAVRQAAEALRYGEDAATVVLVTDGLETCDADPCALGRELEATGLNFTAHVIGFGLSGAEGAQVACLASETGGQYLQASDAGGLADALTATVTAKLPPPQPAPMPEPKAALPMASLTVPDTAPAGSALRVEFNGPHEEYDYVRVLDARGEWLAETAVDVEPFVDVRLPFKTGPHEVVYLFKGQEIIARAPLMLIESAVSITAPEKAQMGSDVTITWVGPGASLDNIQLYRQADNERFTYAYVKDLTELTFTMPDEPGIFEFRYVFQDSEVIHVQPITLTLDKVSAPALAAPTETAETTDSAAPGFVCAGSAPCPFTDAASGLGFTLPAGWSADTPFFYETAAGVAADLPTTAFYLDQTQRLELNPLRWVEGNGPCMDTAAGALCRWAGASTEVIAAQDSIAASLVWDRAALPALPGVALPLPAETAATLRAKLYGEN